MKEIKSVKAATGERARCHCHCYCKPGDDKQTSDKDGTREAGQFNTGSHDSCSCGADSNTDVGLNTAADPE